MTHSLSALPEIRLALLGPTLLEVDGKAVTLRRRKAELLLAYLALERAPHPREKIAALFWGDSTDAQARLSLRVTLAELRKAIHPRLILADREGMQLHPGLNLRLDVAELAALARRVKRLPTPSSPPAMDEALTALDALYRGEFMPGQYDEWILRERERVRRMYLDLLLELTTLLRSAGEYARAVATAQRVLAQDPANEQAHQHLMVCFATLGDRTAALAQYETAVTALREELGVEPSPETRALVERIARHPPGASPAAPLTNLPKPPNGLIGREKVMQEICSVLGAGRSAPGHPPPVTLTGSGGSGKTRLAIEVGRALVHEYADGVWWIELSALSSEALLAQTICKTLGVQRESNANATEEASLADFLRPRQALLVLDNCEHLISACARLVALLARECPHVQFLATSREPLSLPGEQAFPVPNLELPPAESARTFTPEELGAFSSVHLLLERVGQASAAIRLTDENASFVAQICRRVDGIPLALEIAAARLQDMSAQELAERLNERFEWLAHAGADAPDRQQTLRALFDWSFELLAPSERALFRRLAVLRGSFDLQAAVSVAYGKMDATSVLDELGTTPLELVEQLLGRLRFKSLVLKRHAPDGTRYELLETIREYASEKLSRAGEVKRIQARHLEHYDALVSAATEKLFSPDQVRWLDFLEREHANVRAALQFAIAAEQTETMIRMVGQLGPFWQLRNYWSEGRMWIRLALERAGSAEPSAPLAKAYACAGVLAWLQGDYTRAFARHQTALEIYTRMEDAWGITNSLNNLALQQEALGKYDEARQLYQEALHLARELDHARLILRVLNNLCSLAYLQGENAASEAYATEALARARAFGDKYALAIALVNRAQVAIAQGALDRALADADEALGVANELGNREFIAEALRHKAMAFLKGTDIDRAREHFNESLRLAFELGAKRQITWSLEGMAQVAAAKQRWVPAARLYAAATALRMQIAIPKDANEQREHALLRETLERELGASGFQTEWEFGRALDLPLAVQAAVDFSNGKGKF